MKSVKLYEEEIKTLVSLPEKSRGRILSAILCDSVGEQLPQMTAMEQAVFTLINGQVKRAEELSQKKQKSANSRWGNADEMQTQSKPDANDMQTQCKPDANLSTNTNTKTNTNTNTDTNTTTETATPVLAAPGGAGVGGEGVNNSFDSGEGAAKGKVYYTHNVALFPGEYAQLVETLGDEGTQWCIDLLSNYKASSGKTYESDFYAIKGWVTRRYYEQNPAVKDPQKPVDPAIKAAQEQILAKYRDPS